MTAARAPLRLPTGISEADLGARSSLQSLLGLSERNELYQVPLLSNSVFPARSHVWLERQRKSSL